MTPDNVRWDDAYMLMLVDASAGFGRYLPPGDAYSCDTPPNNAVHPRRPALRERGASLPAHKPTHRAISRYPYASLSNATRFLFQLFQAGGYQAVRGA